MFQKATPVSPPKSSKSLIVAGSVAATVLILGVLAYFYKSHQEEALKKRIMDRLGPNWQLLSINKWSNIQIVALSKFHECKFDISVRDNCISTTVNHPGCPQFVFVYNDGKYDGKSPPINCINDFRTYQMSSDELSKVIYDVITQKY